MRRTDVTYGQLDKALHALGFSSHMVKGEPPARRYEHEGTGAGFSIPPYPETDFVLDYHLVGARTIADLFGVAEPKVFDSHLRKAAGKRRPSSLPE